MTGDVLIATWAAAGLGAALFAAMLLCRFRAIGWISPPILALILVAILASLGAIPRADNAVYAFVSGPALQAALFLMLLQVDIGVLRRAGPAMLTLFVAGVAGVGGGVALSAGVPFIERALGATLPSFAGLFTAGYTGGAINFNAVAAILGLDRAGTVYVTAVAADTVYGVIWLGLGIAASHMARRSRRSEPRDAASEEPVPTPTGGTIDVLGLSALATATALAMLAAGSLSLLLPTVHPLLWLTGIALAAGATPLGRLGRDAEPIAVTLLFLFIAAIGRDVSIMAVAANGGVFAGALVMIAVILTVHVAVIALATWAMRSDVDSAVIASQAAIGGPPTVLVLATAIGRPDLRLPGVAVGLFGYAIGTYCGAAAASLLAP